MSGHLGMASGEMAPGETANVRDEDPFGDLTDPRVYFATPKRQAAYAGLLAGTSETMGLTLLTGETGVGKTTLLHKLQAERNASVRFVLHECRPEDRFEDLIVHFARALGVGADGDEEAGMAALDRGLRTLAKDGGGAALLLDDADRLGDAELLGLRRLMDLKLGDRRLVHIVLAGTPALAARVQGDTLRALGHDIAVHRRLEPLRDSEVAGYIRHRLRLAGAEAAEPFEPEAIAAVGGYAGGLPRLVNRLCAAAKARAAESGAEKVSVAAVEVAAHGLGLSPSIEAARDGRRNGAARITVIGGDPATGRPIIGVALDGRRLGASWSTLGEVDLTAAPPTPAGFGEGVRRSRRKHAAPAAEPTPAPTPAATPATEPTAPPPTVTHPRVPPAQGGGGPRPRHIAAVAALLVLLAGGGLLYLTEPWVKRGDGVATEKIIDLRPAAGPSMARRAEPAPLTVAPATGREDTAIPLAIGLIEGAADADKAVILLGGLPDGAELSAGSTDGQGHWRLAASDLAGLTLKPPPDSDAGFDLTVNTADGGYAALTLPIRIEAVADRPTLSVAAAHGREDTAIPLRIAASPIDGDGSETLSLVIEDLPHGASLSAGVHLGDGRWSLMAGEQVGLAVRPPGDSAADFELTVVARSVEATNGDSARNAATLKVEVEPVADPARLTVALAEGKEDERIALRIEAAPADADGSETVAIALDGLPMAALLSAGRRGEDGIWRLDADQLYGLTVKPPPDFNGRLLASVIAITVDGADEAVTEQDLEIVVQPVADPPKLEVDAAKGRAGVPIPLAIKVRPANAREKVLVTVSGLPSGAGLTAGGEEGDGIWRLELADLDGLLLLPPADFEGRISLIVEATSTDGADWAMVSAELPVAVDPSEREGRIPGAADTALADPASPGQPAPAAQE